MAHLNKLAIRGIRSFDDKNIAVIEFFSPVTVIVGHNGSGKTTIIEALKYATTGDHPPNTRGGAFIHDPQMANEREVKAQVKLRFSAANGKKMLAVRNLSVTAKKTGGLTMKTLESILALAEGNTGKRGVISTKCAEMDIEIPQLLGVSKAVLENVIFCHQEDSYWPLAEASVLKKKFDDIFEATRYTKALENIKTLRKDRVAELAAEREVLKALDNDNKRAKTLRERIANLQDAIAAKDARREEAESQHAAIAAANRNLQKTADAFRQTYLRYEGLEKELVKLNERLANAKLSVKEIDCSDEELQQRIDNYDEEVNQRRDKLKKAEAKHADVEDELQSTRGRQNDLTTKKGRLEAEAQAQRDRIESREIAIHQMSETHDIKGFNQGPLDNDKTVLFVSKLEEARRRVKTKVEKHQSDSKSIREEFTSKSQSLTAAFQKHKADQASLKEQLSERQKNISSAENQIDDFTSLPGEIQTLDGDLEEKRNRITKASNDYASAQYDKNIQEKTATAQRLDLERDSLNSEFKALSTQADSRAKLDYLRTEVKTKSAEIKALVDTANVKFSRMSGGKATTAATFERDSERLHSDKEDTLTRHEQKDKTANSVMQTALSMVSTIKKQLKEKTKELSDLRNKMNKKFKQATSSDLDGQINDSINSLDELEEAIAAARREMNEAKENFQSVDGQHRALVQFREKTKVKKVCMMCTRHMNDTEFEAFEVQMTKLMSRVSEASDEDAMAWEEQMEAYVALRPLQTSIDTLSKELPELEKEAVKREQAAELATTEAEKASSELESAKRESKDAGNMKQQASNVAKLLREVEKANRDVEALQADLNATGSTKTVGEVEEALNGITSQIRALEKEKLTIGQERDRQNQLLNTLKNDLHRMELERQELNMKVREKESLEERVRHWKTEITTMNARLKDIGVKISEAQAPIDALEAEHREQQDALTAQISAAQIAYQELNRSCDNLTTMNKDIEKYVRARGAKQLEECDDALQDIGEELERLKAASEEALSVVRKLETDIAQGDANLANLRGNKDMRKQVLEISDTEKELKSIDLDEAAKASRNYQAKWDEGTAEEKRLNNEHLRLGGEVASQRAQLETAEGDYVEYKDVPKRYKDQLIKVKMSDWANSDLEKYAKALENAIMKYHTLKMEEVNDTMRHLWSKTYQGTDIDSIMIKSEVEGAANKRSHNYRVVMMKDQVEMDMRGRCSAGQKMLASIVIRLALSDSFGQNCGILALDEPTNALDTENIDALASSLVDIINERKGHSNFQLLIITHDENFLRKLGQNDVMEHYWRISRDTRQKSIIERQRFQ